MNTKLSFADIVDLFATKTGQSKKEAELFLRELLDTMASKMCEEGLLKIRDFGTFKVVEVESRESVDVNTGDKIVIASHRKISFTADKTLKDLVNKPFSLFEPELLKDGVSFENSEPEAVVLDAESESDEDETSLEMDKSEAQSIEIGVPSEVEKHPREESESIHHAATDQTENNERLVIPPSFQDSEAAISPKVSPVSVADVRQKTSPVSAEAPSFAANKRDSKMQFSMRSFMNILFGVMIVAGIGFIIYLFVVDKQFMPGILFPKSCHAA